MTKNDILGAVWYREKTRFSRKKKKVRATHKNGLFSRSPPQNEKNDFSLFF